METQNDVCSLSKSTSKLEFARVIRRKFNLGHQEVIQLLQHYLVFP